MHIQAATRIEKPWGYELLWAATDKYAGKLLHVRAGEKLSRQFHTSKDEWQHVLSGRIIIEIGRGDMRQSATLGPGDGIHIEAGTVHRLIGVTDAVVLEASTPELGDVVRLEDAYGRVPTAPATIPAG